MICFQNLYLWYSDTTDIYGQLVAVGCDLLSKFISLIFWYNQRNFSHFKRKLWFAFKIYIFDILIQQAYTVSVNTSSCDLLSKFISLIFWYNALHITLWEHTVVICFQNLYLWYSDTTSRLTVVQNRELWFAFKIYIFDILIQLV